MRASKKEEEEAFRKEVDRLHSDKAWRDEIIMQIQKDPSFDFISALRERYFPPNQEAKESAI